MTKALTFDIDAKIADMKEQNRKVKPTFRGKRIILASPDMFSREKSFKNLTIVALRKFTETGVFGYENDELLILLREHAIQDSANIFSEITNAVTVTKAHFNRHTNSYEWDITLPVEISVMLPDQMPLKYDREIFITLQQDPEPIESAWRSVSRNMISYWQSKP